MVAQEALEAQEAQEALLAAPTVETPTREGPVTAASISGRAATADSRNSATIAGKLADCAVSLRTFEVQKSEH